MIDQIFSMIMKEANARPGKDLDQNLYTIFKELGHRLIARSNHIRETKRREKNHEEQTTDSGSA